MEAVMDRKLIEDITARFQALAAVVPLHVIRSAQDYDKAVAVQNQLLDAGGRRRALGARRLVEYDRLAYFRL